MDEHGVISLERVGDKYLISPIHLQDLLVFRTELAALRDLAEFRLASVEQVWPFGSTVDLTASRLLPEDETMLRVLNAFLRHLPRDSWSCFEQEVWQEIAEGCDRSLALLPRSNGHILLAKNDAEWLYGAAIGVGNMIAAREHTHFERMHWLYNIASALRPLIIPCPWQESIQSD